MDRLEFIKFLDLMNQEELQDYLELVWHGEVELTDWEENELIDRIHRLEVEKPEEYIMVWLVLLALIAIDAGKITPITALFNTLPEPGLSEEYDLMWVTESDDSVCELCAPLHGKIYGVDFTLRPKLHPNCRCRLVKVPKGRRAIMDKIRTLDAGAVRAVIGGKKRILEVLAAPFGSPTRKDRFKQFFTARTNVIFEMGDKRPTLYLHGHSPRKRKMVHPPSLGVAEVIRMDDKGVWMQTELDDSELSTRTWNAALEGKARASTGSVNYLERHDNVTGEVYCWPIAELSVFDAGDKRIPVSDDAIVLPLRALFDEHSITLPDGFEAGEDKRSEVDSTKTIGDKMDKKEINTAVAEALAARDAEQEAEAALRAEIKADVEKDLKGDPEYRATFNIIPEQKDKGLDEVELENFAYCRSLIEDAKLVFKGGMPSGAMRASTLALEESEVGEIGPMVPDDMLNKIHVLLGKYSLVDKLSAAGLMTIYKTDKLVFNVPTEVTALALQADIAEEGAYTANTPEFVNTPVTMQKVGSYVSITEEALEDQDLFQQWIVKAVAKSIALAKNLDLHTLMDATGGTEIGTTDVITDAEMIAMYYSLAQEYREGACMIMNDLTLAYIRAMLVATPRAYGEFGFNPMSMGEMGEHFLNKPVYTNANWVALIGGATNDAGITFADLNEMIVWVERRKFSIFVDPYSTKLSAGTVNFLPSARYAGATVNAAAHAGIELLT